MPMEEEPDPISPTTDDHILDWLGDSISFPTSFLDDPYNGTDGIGINSYQWWDDQDQDQDQELINASSSINSSTTSLPNPPLQSLPGSSKKRKQAHNSATKTPNHRRQRNQFDTLSGDENADNNDSCEELETVRKHVPVNGAKRASAKASSGSGSNSGSNKDARWAEQLLNPCALAISAGNLSRVQHLVYVLHELASASGDANHRLAAHGLSALNHHLSSSPVSFPGSAMASYPTFATTEPRVFQNSLLKFHELSPWFSFPNSFANASILQTLSRNSTGGQCRNLRIIDIGVSHGIQWPTLLESLANRSGGAPHLIHLTIVAPNTPTTAFSLGPHGYDYPSQLLRFAKRINLNLQITQIENRPLQTLIPHTLGLSPVTHEEETVIVCAQFRVHELGHEDPDYRTRFLERIRDLDPDLLVLTENEGECSCCKCGDFARGFEKRVEWMWKFLDSTSAAFKGRECEERRVMEGEAAISLWSGTEMNEGKVGWCERMRRVGFVGEKFGEEAMEGGKALLRKYDCNWEMKVEEKGDDGCISLCWKGHPVSFCSLWKLNSSSSSLSTLSSKSILSSL